MVNKPKARTSFKSNINPWVQLWDNDLDILSVTKRVYLGKPVLDTSGPIANLTWPQVGPIGCGPVDLISGALKIWSDKRFTFAWQVKNNSGIHQMYFGVSLYFAYNDSLHEPIHELKELSLMYERFASGETAKRVRREYYYLFEPYFSWLYRSDITGVLKLKTDRRY